MNYVEQMKPAMEQAGTIVMSYFRGDFSINQKKDRSLATEADLASEDFLKKALLKIIPQAGFIAEESGSTKDQEFMWVIDPIDGTKNFSRGIPYFCINVALMHHAQLLAAVTYYPAMNEWFYAQKGHGAWHNGKRLDLSKKNWEHKGALVVVSDFRIRQCDLLASIKKELSYIKHGVRFRVYGAAALDLAYVAAGSFDAVLFENLGWWDAAAGVLLVQEAGGYVCEYDGSPVTKSFKTLLAGHAQICHDLLGHLAK